MQEHFGWEGMVERGMGSISRGKTFEQHSSVGDNSWEASLIRRFSYLLRKRVRRARYEFFWKAMQPADTAPLLDLGGGSGSFLPALFPQKSRVIITDININNLQSTRESLPEVILVVADGIQMPFADESIGCVFCNSVVEHVDQPAELAREIARIGRNYFVQTPHRGFPLETHSFIPIPLYHHLPPPVQRRLCRLFGASYEYISSVRYLSEAELRKMFPDATLYKERFLGLTKSFYLCRTAEGEK